MADGGVIQQSAEEVSETAKEVATDFKDSVGEAIEQGIQSVVGNQLTPQQIQQKQQEDQRDLSETRRKIEFLKNIDQEQRRVIQANKQKEAQRIQDQNQEKQATEMKKEQRKNAVNPALANIGKVEIKGGVGG